MSIRRIPMARAASRAAYWLPFKQVGRAMSSTVSADVMEESRVQRDKYQALSTLVARQMPTGLPLSAYELAVFSQNGEDGVLYELCRRINVPPTFVEFGIGTGVEGNCVLLADVFGWSGLFIEPVDSAYKALALKYKPGGPVTTLRAAVTPENVEAIFSQAGVPRDLGVLSIDIDGNDYWVWERITSWSPVIVVVEFNSVLPFDEPVVQPLTDGPPVISSSFGASLSEMERLGKSKGYRLVHVEMAGVNAFFVRSDVTSELPDVARHGLNYYLAGARFQHPRST